MVVCLEQNLGQNLNFRETFDIAVARAVAEMRVLGNCYTEIILLYFLGLCLIFISFCFL